jgi:hypothetical protein
MRSDAEPRSRGRPASTTPPRPPPINRGSPRVLHPHVESTDDYDPFVHDFGPSTDDYASLVHDYASFVHDYASVVHDFVESTGDYAPFVHNFA